MILSGLRSQLVDDSSLTAIVSADSVFIGMAGREARAPYVVIHRVDAPPAQETLDGASALREGLFQFDSYQDNQVDAVTLSSVVEDVLRDFGGTLPDGSTIQVVEVTNCGDDAYQVGGSAFIFRSVVRLRAFFTE